MARKEKIEEPDDGSPSARQLAWMTLAADVRESVRAMVAAGLIHQMTDPAALNQFGLALNELWWVEVRANMFDRELEKLQGSSAYD